MESGGVCTIGALCRVESSHLENTNTFMSGNIIPLYYNQRKFEQKRNSERDLTNRFFYFKLSHPIFKTNVRHLQVMKVNPLSNSKSLIVFNLKATRRMPSPRSTKVSG